MSLPTARSSIESNGSTAVVSRRSSVRRGSFIEQMGPTVVGFCEGVAGGDFGATRRRCSKLAAEIDCIMMDVTSPFESKFAPSEMRQLALVAHNHMKPAMKDFISTYSEVLKKFRITGTQTTMRMCKTMWGEDDPDIRYGLTCTSGPLGGDAQIAALMCMEDLGALIFFVDPLSAHPHQADIDSLIRLSNCGNVIVCPNPTSAMSMMHTLKIALNNGSRGMIPSFFETLESPAVDEYKRQQELALTAAVAGRPIASTMTINASATTTNGSSSSGAKPVLLGTDPSFFHPNIADNDDEDDYDEYDSDEEYDEFLASLQEEQYSYNPGERMSTANVASTSTNLYGIKATKPQKSMTRNIATRLAKSLSKKISF